MLEVLAQGASLVGSSSGLQTSLVGSREPGAGRCSHCWGRGGARGWGLPQHWAGLFPRQAGLSKSKLGALGTQKFNNNNNSNIDLLNAFQKAFFKKKNKKKERKKKYIRREYIFNVPFRPLVTDTCEKNGRTISTGEISLAEQMPRARHSTGCFMGLGFSNNMVWAMQIILFLSPWTNGRMPAWRRLSSEQQLQQ